MKNGNRMMTEKISSLMREMAIPTVIAQIINVLYSIVDRIYIGHIPNASDAALTGVGVTLPIITFISAFSSFVGAGGAPLASIYQGKGDKERAEKFLGSGTTMLIFFSVTLMFFFYIFMDPILYFFGASEGTISYAKTYLSIYLAGTLFVQLALGLNPFIVAQGASKTGMVSVLIGAALNLLLDPLFIFVFHMGVAGAGWATVISQMVSASWVIAFLVNPHAELRLRLKNMKPDFHIIKRIASLGISPFVMDSTSSLMVAVLNKGMQTYGGDLYVGSITVMESMMQLINAPLTGFTQGVQPIISYNYGAKRFDRVHKAYRSMIFITAGSSFIVTSLFMIFPGFFASFFTNSEPLIELCQKKIPIFMAGMLLFGFQKGIQPTFVALSQAKISIFIAVLRKIILLIPLAIILPIKLGTQGIYIAEPISDIISATTAIILFVVNIRKILTEESVDLI